MAPLSPIPVGSEEGSQVSNSPSRSLSRGSADGATEDNKADVAPPQPQPQPPAQNAQEAVDTFPGWRPMNGRESEGVSDVVDTLKLLNDAGVFGCVVGVNALRYYGAGRVIWEWDICVPTVLFEEAVQLIASNDMYERVGPCPPNYRSVRHLNPVFQLKGVVFYFVLTPASRCFFDPKPKNCETSKGVPYPTMPHFARSLLALQNGPDLADFVDGMDLDAGWGQENIDFEDLQVKGMEFAKAMNTELVADGRIASFYTDIDFQKHWDSTVSSKEARIEPMKKGRYKTRWRRIKKDTDPRLRDRPF